MAAEFSIAKPNVIRILLRIDLANIDSAIWEINSNLYDGVYQSVVIKNQIFFPQWDINKGGLYGGNLPLTPSFTGDQVISVCVPFLAGGSAFPKIHRSI